MQHSARSLPCPAAVNSRPVHFTTSQRSFCTFPPHYLPSCQLRQLCQQLPPLILLAWEKPSPSHPLLPVHPSARASAPPPRPSLFLHWGLLGAGGDPRTPLVVAATLQPHWVASPAPPPLRALGLRQQHWQQPPPSLLRPHQHQHQHQPPPHLQR